MSALIILSLALIGLGVVLVARGLAACAPHDDDIERLPLGPPSRRRDAIVETSIPSGESNPYRPPAGLDELAQSRGWIRFRNSTRRAELVVALGLALVLGTLAAAPLAVALKPRLGAVGAWIVITTVVVTVLAILLGVWHEPARRRRLTYLSRALVARGVESKELEAGEFVGAARWNSAESVGRGCEDVGILWIRESAVAVELASGGHLEIAHTAWMKLTRERPLGETLAWYGVRLIRLDWRSRLGTMETIYLLAKAGEDVFTLKRATDVLAERLMRWHAAPPRG